MCALAPYKKRGCWKKRWRSFFSFPYFLTLFHLRAHAALSHANTDVVKALYPAVGPFTLFDPKSRSAWPLSEACLVSKFNTRKDRLSLS